MINNSNIDKFLAQVKSSIKSNNYQILDHRNKYRYTLAMLGITTDDVLDDICNLTKNDFWLPPEPDNNPNFPGDVWQCKKYLHNSLIYIKMKFKIDETGKLIIMSYHFDNMR